MKKSLLVAVSAAALIATGTPAFAQDDGKLDTITVTATKKAVDAQDVPVSLTALDDDLVATYGNAGDDIQFLSAKVPSLIIESSFGRIFPRPYIRGLGNTDFDLNASQPVSFIYDEVVYENPVLKGFPIFDIERIEVLRGPQGTLFGRNTPAGAIKFESVKPGDEFDAYFKASLASFDTTQVQGAVGGPVSDTLSLRASAIYQSRNDYIQNQVLGDRGNAGGYEDFAWRLQALYEPTDQFSWLLNTHGRSLEGGQVSFQANAFETGRSGARPGFDREQSFADAGADSVLDTDTFGVTSRAEYDFGNITGTYIFGYEEVETFSRGDVDGGFGAVFAPPSGPGLIPFTAETADGIEDHSQVTHEIRFSNSEPQAVDWTAGLYIFDEELTISSFSYDTLANGIENGFALQTQDTQSWALFGSLSTQLAENLTGSIGVRYTDDEKDLVAERFQTPVPFTGASDSLGPLTESVSDEQFSWDASLTYAVDENTNVFGRIARGYRAPSIQGRVLFGDVITTADSEIVDSIEAGVKSTLAEGRVQADFTAFYYKVDDQQLTAIGGAGNFNQLLNAEEGIGYGFEADVRALISDNLTLSSGISYNNTEINDSDLTVGICGSPCTVLDDIDATTGGALIDGNPFPQAPEWIANVALDYEREFMGGELFASTDWSYRSDANVFLYESVEFTSEGWVEGGASIGYREGPWYGKLFARNITDEVGVVSAIDFNNLSGIFNQPRVVGVEIGWNSQ
jgi:iron complex outermembrane receptor protein